MGAHHILTRLDDGPPIFLLEISRPTFVLAAQRDTLMARLKGYSWDLSFDERTCIMASIIINMLDRRFKVLGRRRTELEFKQSQWES